MSVSRGFGLNGKSMYMNIAKPQVVQCNFVVDSTNGNGLGIRSLKSNGYVNNVFMNTSATPGTNNGLLNPNPAAGIVMVQFTNNFNYSLTGYGGFASPVAGAALTSVTANVTYIITALGTATLAQWQARGFPVGFTPEVGAAFVATSTGLIGGSAEVRVPGVSGVSSIEVIGNPNATISNSNISKNAGAIYMLQILGATDASTTTMIPKAPAAGTVIGLSFWYDGSSVSVDGL